MAENLVCEEYAVNYQKDDKVLENSKMAEKSSDRVSEQRSVFLAWPHS
jgi:hypothetical protein